MNEPIRVVRGQPSQHELAALISVLLILRRRHHPAGESTRASPASWTRSRAYEAPGAWSSGRPSRTIPRRTLGAAAARLELTLSGGEPPADGDAGQLLRRADLGHVRAMWDDAATPPSESG